MRRSIRPVRVLLLAAALAAAAPLAAQESTNYSYTWWNAAEPGWGYNLSHQGDLLYGTWYSYAEDGKPMFLTVEGLRNEDGSFSGPVYRVAGTPFQQINGSQAFTAVTEVGSAQMSFAGADLHHRWHDADAHADPLHLFRQPAGLCRHHRIAGQRQQLFRSVVEPDRSRLGPDPVASGRCNLRALVHLW